MQGAEAEFEPSPVKHQKTPSNCWSHQIGGYLFKMSKYEINSSKFAQILKNFIKFHLKFLYTGCRSKNLHPSHKMTQITRKLSNITIYIYMCYFRGMHANSASAPCKPFANFDRISTTWKPFTNFDRIDKICMIYITISNYMSHFKGTNSASAPCKPFANFDNIRTL